MKKEKQNKNKFFLTRKNDKSVVFCWNETDLEKALAEEIFNISILPFCIHTFLTSNNYKFQNNENNALFFRCIDKIHIRYIKFTGKYMKCFIINHEEDSCKLIYNHIIPDNFETFNELMVLLES